MNVQPNILSVIQRVLLSVGVDASDQNLLQKGRPFIMRGRREVPVHFSPAGAKESTICSGIRNPYNKTKSGCKSLIAEHRLTRGLDFYKGMIRSLMAIRARCR